jgi:ribosomal protein L37AE/L43A
MPQNPIQFQKGLSLEEFLKEYGTEEQCEQALERWRWPQGFICPSCGRQHAPVRLRTRGLWQCRHCGHQASLTAGTVFEATKLPLATWFLAMFLLTQQKNGISALELKRHLGVSYLTAWRIKHKLLQVMKERDDRTPLGGVIAVDDAYWGGERHGAKPGRGSPNKVPFITALSCNDEGHPIALRLGRVAGFRKTAVERFAKRHFDPNAIVLSDGLACFTGIASAGLEHQIIVTGGGYRSMAIPEFQWLNTVLGNVKNSLHGSYHQFSGKHLPRYLGEFCYRFNRRFDLAAMLPRLGWAAVRTPPMPHRLLKIAEAC